MGAHCSCGKPVRPCPAARWAGHKDGIHCQGWLHDGGSHGDGHLAAPASPERPGRGPRPAGRASAPLTGRAAEPGTPPVPPCSDGVPGTQVSRSGRAARDAAPGTGVQAWRKALADQAKAKRNRRGKRPGPEITGVRIPPPGGER